MRYELSFMRKTRELNFHVVTEPCNLATILKIEDISMLTETSVTICMFTQYYNPEYHNLTTRSHVYITHNITI